MTIFSNKRVDEYFLLMVNLRKDYKSCEQIIYRDNSLNKRGKSCPVLSDGVNYIPSFFLLLIFFL